MLLEYAYAGCPVDCGPDWTKDQLEAAITRGSHPSAKVPEAAQACHDEAMQRVLDGCCRLVPWKQIRDNPPHNLKISPIAAIPHKSRKFRMILDLAFRLKVNNERITSVNEASDKTLAPQHAMYELGNVIPRIIHTMANAPNTGIPFLFSKIDLKDGYWRMVVNKRDAWNFAYVLPAITATDEPTLVIPDSLQMGWSESPPFFCAATETARDVAAKALRTNSQANPHPMEHVMMNIDWTTIPAHTTEPHLTKFLTLMEVYVDDFIALVQSTNPHHLRKVSRHLLHAIDSVFPDPAVTGSKMGPAISTKKLIAEGTWETRKEILGWLLDGIARTIELPQRKVDALLTTIKTIRRSPRPVRLNEFQQLHGKLQFCSISIPGGKALLGPLDKIIARTIATQRTSIKINDTAKLLLSDWAALITLTRTRPTHVNELVEHTPTYRGFVDAAKWGVGGVWFGGTRTLQPFVWFLPWPTAVRDQFCSSTNKTGAITISDLELMGIFLHFLALEEYTKWTSQPLKHQSVAIWCDNLPAVAWTYKFRTATSQVAARILRAFAVRLHATHSALLNIQHISGSYNIMADMASREHSTDPTTFLTNFTQHFPPPQNNFWTLFQFGPTLASKAFSELHPKPSQLASWRRLKRRGGVFGKLGTNGYTPISPACPTTSSATQHPTNNNCWLPSPTMCDPAAFLAANAKFEPKLSKWRFAPSARPSNWMENLTHWKARKAAIQRRSNNSWKATKEPTRPPNPALPYPSRSRDTSTSPDQHPRAPKRKRLEKWPSSPFSTSSASENTRIRPTTSALNRSQSQTSRFGPAHKDYQLTPDDKPS